MWAMLCLILAAEGNLQKQWQVNLEDLDMLVPYRYTAYATLVSVADDGTVFVADIESGQILILDSQGNLKKKFGRKGPGPGEFLAIAVVGWVEQDQALYALDPYKFKISKFTKNGGFFSEYKSDGFIRNPTFHQNDRVFFVKNAFGAKGSSPKVADTNMGTGKQTVIWKMPPLKKHSGYQKKDKNSRVAIKMMWDPTLLIASASDFLVANYNSQSELFLIDINDHKVKTLKTEIPAIPLTAEQREFVFEGEDKSQLARLRKVASKPEYWPYFRSIIVDDQDRIWLNTFQKTSTSNSNYYVYNRTGTKLHEGDVFGFPHAVRSGHLYVIATDQNNMQFLVKYRFE